MNDWNLIFHRSPFFLFIFHRIFHSPIYIKHPKTNFQHLKLRFFLPKVCTIKNIAYLCNRKPKEIGAIAQLVEQRTENPCVPGSIPGGTTFTKRKIMKTAEIQLFQRFFLYVLSAKMCNPVQ